MVGSSLLLTVELSLDWGAYDPSSPLIVELPAEAEAGAGVVNTRTTGWAVEGVVLLLLVVMVDVLLGMTAAEIAGMEQLTSAAGVAVGRFHIGRMTPVSGFHANTWLAFTGRAEVTFQHSWAVSDDATAGALSYVAHMMESAEGLRMGIAMLTGTEPSVRGQPSGVERTVWLLSLTRNMGVWVELDASM